MRRVRTWVMAGARCVLRDRTRCLPPLKRDQPGARNQQDRPVPDGLRRLPLRYRREAQGPVQLFEHQAHNAQHEQLVKSFLRLKDRMLTGGNQRTSWPGCEDLVADWLLNHTRYSNRLQPDPRDVPEAQGVMADASIGADSIRPFTIEPAFPVSCAASSWCVPFSLQVRKCTSGLCLRIAESNNTAMRESCRGAARHRGRESAPPDRDRQKCSRGDSL